MADRFSVGALAAALVGDVDIEAVAVSSVPAESSLLAGAAVGAVQFRLNDSSGLAFAFFFVYP